MEDMGAAERSEEEKVLAESSGLFVDDVPKPVISREMLEDESWDDDEELELEDVKKRQKKQLHKKPQGRAYKRARRAAQESADEGEESEFVPADQKTGIENEDFLFENDPSIDRIVSQSLRHDPTLVRAQMTGSEARRVLGSAKNFKAAANKRARRSAPESADEGEESEVVSACQKTGIENEDFLFENDPCIDRIVSQALRHDPTLVRAQMTGSEARRVLGSAKNDAQSEDELDDFLAPDEEVDVSSTVFIRLEDQPVLGVTVSSCNRMIDAVHEYWRISKLMPRDVQVLCGSRFVSLETTIEELNLTPRDVLELAPVSRTLDPDPNLLRAQTTSSTLIIDLEDNNDEDEGKDGLGGGAILLEEPISQVYSAGLDSQTENLIQLRVRSKRGSKKYRMKKNDPIQKILVKFCASQNRKPEDAKMIFDGDIITGSHTPEILDLEDEDLIEVAFQD
eukprot:CAMPEP_0184754480 /NCGR_PEP_ID=MMETSP0315-20130426/44645_1 /TAXON_ID=101924 /ORGANISM="Rhodosorus marinus, Strain UTEX LB 2760" /LENGTH=452 /DNA_ID=CAMNT_0027233903 /DNA_START=294 /DNA_END=1651 /DNA_ORIENTATION=-